MSDYYDRAGLPISMAEWSRLHGIYDYRRVALTTVGPYEVSTVWLGLDHGFGFGEGPLIFETMVFAAADHNATDLDCDRYSTEAAARQGHDDIVTLIRATEGIDIDHE